MKYTPDYKYKEAKELISSLDESVHEYELILYYINKRENYITDLEKRLHEYQDWFKQMDKFLPNKNPVFK
jgi:hypothetical protein